MASNNTIQFIELVSLGSVNATLVEPMNVFRVAVMKGSEKVILVHNHPSGELNPSEDDITNNGQEVTIDKSVYTKLVLDFADKLENFYKTSLPKTIPTDDFDRKG